MRYILTFGLIVIAFLLMGIIDYEFSLYLKLELVGLFSLTYFYLEYSAITNKIQGEFSLKSRRKVYSRWDISLNIMLMCLYLFNFGTSSPFVALMASILLVKASISLIYRIKQPTTLVIQDDKLTLAGVFFETRNLKNLTKISYDRIDYILILTFKDSRSLKIRLKEYVPEEWDSLIDLLLDKSEFDVIIPENYLTEKNNR